MEVAENSNLIPKGTHFLAGKFRPALISYPYDSYNQHIVVNKSRIT